MADPTLAPPSPKLIVEMRKAADTLALVVERIQAEEGYRTSSMALSPADVHTWADRWARRAEIDHLAEHLVRMLPVPNRDASWWREQARVIIEDLGFKPTQPVGGDDDA